MKVGIFVVTPGRQGGGPETYEVQLLRALAKIDQRNEYVVYCTHRGAIEAIGVQRPNFQYRVLQPQMRWLSIPVTLPAMLVKDGVDFFHATMVPPPFATKNYLLTILCSSNWKHPEFYEKRVVWRLNKLLARGMKSASMFLCISGQLMDEVQADFQVARERLRVTYMGVGVEFEPKGEDAARRWMSERHGIDYPYILFVGQQQERKNVLRVIEAYGRYRADSSSDARLLLVGRSPDEVGPISEQIRKFGLEQHVKRIGYFPFAELPYLYSGARMLAFPSLWEGFGIPVIESMACGTPVVTSTATCLPEIAGDSALVVDPQSVDEIAGAMTRIEREPGLRRTLIERGLERAKLFSWENCARSTLDAYSRMADAAKGAH